jgi:hypothetical protein
MSCSTNFCKKRVLKEHKKLKNFGKAIKKSFKAKTMSKANRAIFDSDRIKRLQAKCENEYCNPTCKGTILESGKNIPKEIKNEYKNMNFMIKNQIQTRKKIFGKKMNVLKNGFYEKLSTKNIKSLKKNGAISGCIQKIVK